MSSLDEVASLPGFKNILKAVIKNQMQCLMDQLSSNTDEEFFLLSANLAEKTLNHLGSESGKCFLDHHDDVMLKFLEFCDKRHHDLSKAETLAVRGIKQSDESYFVFKTRAKSWKKILPKKLKKKKGNTGALSLPEVRGSTENPTTLQQLPQENDFQGNLKNCSTPRVESREQRKRRIDPYPVALVSKNVNDNTLNISEHNVNSKDTPTGIDMENPTADQTVQGQFQVKSEPLDFDEDFLVDSDHNLQLESEDLSNSFSGNYGIENDAQQVLDKLDENKVVEEERDDNSSKHLNVTIQTIPESDIKLEAPDHELDHSTALVDKIEPSTSYSETTVSRDDYGNKTVELEKSMEIDNASPSKNLRKQNSDRVSKKPDKIHCLYCNSYFDDNDDFFQHRFDNHGSDVDWFEHESQLAEFRALNSLTDSADGNSGVSTILKCPYRSCKKKFTEEPKYIEHLNEHFGLFTCFKCDKKIRGRPNRNTHIRICTGLTSYRCELCNREYTNITALKRHTLTVHLSKRYVCDCGMVYRYSSSLVKHQKKNPQCKLNQSSKF